MTQKTLAAALARYMDPNAFDPVESKVGKIAPEVGRAMAEKRKIRREIAMKRARSAIRFFKRPENREALDRAVTPEEPVQ